MDHKRLLKALAQSRARIFYHHFGKTDLQELRVYYGLYPYAGNIPTYCEAVFSDVALKDFSFDCVFSNMEKSEVDKNFSNTEIRPKFYYCYVL